MLYSSKGKEDASPFKKMKLWENQAELQFIIINLQIWERQVYVTWTVPIIQNEDLDCANKYTREFTVFRVLFFTLKPNTSNLKLK